VDWPVKGQLTTGICLKRLGQTWIPLRGSMGDALDQPNFSLQTKLAVAWASRRTVAVVSCRGCRVQESDIRVVHYYEEPVIPE